MSAHKGFFQSMYLHSLSFSFGRKQGWRGSSFGERNWTNEILMSAHTNIVIAHKRYFLLCD